MLEAVRTTAESGDYIHEELIESEDLSNSDGSRRFDESLLIIDDEEDE